METSFGTPHQKSADSFKFVITQLSYTSQRKKVNTISHVRQAEGLTTTLITIDKSFIRPRLDYEGIKYDQHNSKLALLEAIR